MFDDATTIRTSLEIYIGVDLRVVFKQGGRRRASRSMVGRDSDDGKTSYLRDHYRYMYGTCTVQYGRSTEDKVYSNKKAKVI